MSKCLYFFIFFFIFIVITIPVYAETHNMIVTFVIPGYQPITFGFTPNNVTIYYGENFIVNYTTNQAVNWSINTSSPFKILSNGTLYNNMTPAADTYIIKVNASTSATSNSSIFKLTVNKAISEVAVYLDDVRGNNSAKINTPTSINVSLLTGAGNITLWVNYSLFNQGESHLTNVTNFTEIIEYNITGIYEGNQNYTADSETWWFIIYLPNTTSNFTIFSAQRIFTVGQIVNVTALCIQSSGTLCYDDVSCKITTYYSNYTSLIMNENTTYNNYGLYNKSFGQLITLGNYPTVVTCSNLNATESTSFDIEINNNEDRNYIALMIILGIISMGCLAMFLKYFNNDKEKHQSYLYLFFALLMMTFSINLFMKTVYYEPLRTPLYAIYWIMIIMTIITFVYFIIGYVYDMVNKVRESDDGFEKL